MVVEAAAAYEERGGYSLVVDLGRHEVIYCGLSVALPPTAFRLLSLLAEKPDRIVSKKELYNRLWGGASGDGTNPGPYEHQLADHKQKILAQIGNAFEAQHAKKPQADQLRNLITAKHRTCTRRTAADVSRYRLNLSASEVRVVK